MPMIVLGSSRTSQPRTAMSHHRTTRPLRMFRSWLVSPLALLVALGVQSCGGDTETSLLPQSGTETGVAGAGGGTATGSGTFTGTGTGGTAGSGGTATGGTAGGGGGGGYGICGNGIQEGDEECDGEPNCDDHCHLIPDADGDGISDDDEGAPSTDTDDDLTFDYQDTDSDGDGIPDSVEAGDDDLRTPPVDTDGDGTPDFQDLDSDDDGIPDAVEAGADPTQPVDSDGDYAPDYVDADSDNDDLTDAEELAAGTDRLNPDSDGDTVSDGDDGVGDADGDGTINALDTDSDGDGYGDAVEAGDGDWQTVPVDSDFDGISDLRDLDSEQDGLPDAQEVNCPALGRDGRLWTDTDFDGYADLAEVLIGSDPCDDQDDVKDHGIEFFFVLPYNDPEQDDVLRFEPTVKMADVFFNVDTTGSMGGEIANLQGGLNTIMNSTNARVDDAAFGVSHFEDFPCNPYGDPSWGDQPFVRDLAPTTNTTTAQAAVNGLGTRNGYDFPESGYEALYQLANGSGISGGACWNHSAYTTAGRVGGAQFRAGSIPILLHITDALAHDATTPTTAGPYGPWAGDYPSNYQDHSKAQAIAALQSIGARVIGVQSLWNDASLDGVVTAQMRELSEQTNTDVPVCAFLEDGGDNVVPSGDDSWRCGANSCCGGTIDDGSGRCILRYTIASNGTGLTQAATDGIDGIIKYTTFDVYNDARDDGDGGTPDTSQFLTRIVSITPDDSFKPPLEEERSCCPVPTPAQFVATTYDDGFTGFATCTSSATQEGAKLFFTVYARNTHVPETDAPQMFIAYIDIIDDTTGAILDTQEVVIIVPAAPGGSGEG